MAFGMTAIHPHHGPQHHERQAASGHGHHVHFQLDEGHTDAFYGPHPRLRHGSGTISMPGSRSNSPPITLPPLKMVSTSPPSQKRDAGHLSDAGEGLLFKKDGDAHEGGSRRASIHSEGGNDAAGEGEEKVELPGFKDFEAAALGPRPFHSDSKMSIDFVC